MQHLQQIRTYNSNREVSELDDNINLAGFPTSVSSAFDVNSDGIDDPSGKAGPTGSTGQISHWDIVVSPAVQATLGQSVHEDTLN